MTIDLYFNRYSGPVRAVWMTVRQLKLDVNFKPVDLAVSEQLKPEFLALNPFHTVPTLVDDGFALWESRAIMQYLCNRYAPDSTLYPKDPKQRALVDRSLNFDLTLLNQIEEVVFTPIFSGAPPSADKVTALNNSFKNLDQVLIKQNKYLVGDQLTLADLSLLAYWVYLEKSNTDVSAYPNFQRWVAGLKAELPYYNEVNGISQAEWDQEMARYLASIAK
ncbi:unnamed protein product [Medioppia subpectinata]|uniref:Glutathione S-transferase n=1 Tax=Medioppia subpectinata TaxID=1979941 RepID=A0A7R9Q3L4_9ACAR|nr:unnamed protein product [Medioppia subpectinata]CAG2111444.1 unnamed protein product [Medioppia subpectinata]